MGWFFKRDDEAIRLRREQEEREEQLVRFLRAIPESRWQETMGGYAADMPGGSTVTLQRMRVSSADGEGHGADSYYLTIGGQRVTIAADRLAPFYHTLASRQAG